MARCCHSSPTYLTVQEYTQVFQPVSRPLRSRASPLSIGSGDDAPVGRFDAIEAAGYKQHYITAVATFVIAVLSLRQFDELVNEGK